MQSENRKMISAKVQIHWIYHKALVRSNALGPAASNSVNFNCQLTNPLFNTVIG